MDLSSSGLFGMMTDRMTWLTARQRVLAENVVNADTPNYKPRDLVEPDFKTTLQQVMVTPTLTNAGHIQTKAALAPGIVEARVRTDDTGLNGNAVSVEDEMMKVSATAVDYQAMTALFKKWQGLFRMALGRS
jgi:flagellar basal-body rod protein FlgB